MKNGFKFPDGGFHARAAQQRDRGMRVSPHCQGFFSRPSVSVSNAVHSGWSFGRCGEGLLESVKKERRQMELGMMDRWPWLGGCGTIRRFVRPGRKHARGAQTVISPELGEIG